MALHGSATIEITNADGSKQIVKHDNMITNAVLTANFFVNILELKYNKSLCTLIFFLMCNITYLFNLKVIEFFNMSIFQVVVYKGIFN